MDSVGIGELPDAAAYGDEGSNTLGNISAHVRLQLPTLSALGLTRLVALRDQPAPPAAPMAAYGRMREASPGKDSVTGHWELMGLVLDRPFPTFPHGFPPDVIEAFEARIGRQTIGNVVGSGTEVMERFGAEHMRTGRPIVYTSADSVFQILAHEHVIPIEEQYAICRAAYELVVEGMGVGRVIARPFVGLPGAFRRTANRHDFAAPPPTETLLDRLVAAGVPVHAVGKIHDLFAGRGTSTTQPTASDDDGMDAIEALVAGADRGPDLRQPRRLRHAVRTPQRRGRLRPEPRALRRPPGRAAAAAAAGRSADRDRRSRQRSDHAQHRSFARARAAAGPRRRLAAGAARRSRHLRRSGADARRASSASTPLAHGTSFCRELWG